MILTSAILEVNLKNLRFNYNYLKYLNKGKYTGAVIKADAYGLGSIKIIKNLYKIGCKHFFVATIDEALKIRKSFKKGNLYVLNGVEKKFINQHLIKNNIIPIINSISDLIKIKSIKKKIKIGIHIDTGINRLGIPIKDLKKYKFNDKLSINLIMSHLASANEKNNNFNKKQELLFNKIANKYFKLNLKSLSNSAGIKLGNNFHYDIVRPGISLYGGHNNSSLKKKIKPVIKLKAKVLQIKHINKNEYVGYNQTFKAKKNMIIAIIGIGYADGIFRKLSNIGNVYYKKYKFKIIGRISMDSITINISNNSKLIKVGDFLEIINYENDIEKIAKICDTISNEILTSISNRVKRIYIN